MKKKLVLHRETLRRLTAQNLRVALGGTTGDSACYDCCNTYDRSCNTLHTDCQPVQD